MGLEVQYKEMSGMSIASGKSHPS